MLGKVRNLTWVTDYGCILDMGLSPENVSIIEALIRQMNGEAASTVTGWKSR